MRTLALVLACLASGLAADFNGGLDAYRRGDFAVAIGEWTPLAEAGDAHAQYNLGLIYANGKGVPPDCAQAVHWYQMAAQQDVPAAEYNLAVIYANQVPPNPTEAARWFQAAAAKGMVTAELGLGNLYYEGPDAMRNYTEAEKWYRLAAGHGFASAAFSLGNMYDLGRGVPQSYPEALYWYRQAAEQGYGPAMVNLGILYYNAEGVKRDLVQAYAWFSRGLQYHDPRSVELLAVALGKLHPRDVNQAKQLAQAWQPTGARQVATNDAMLFKPPPVDTATTQSVTTPAQAPQTPAGH